MRIAHIVGTFPPYFGGVGNVCYHNALELVKLGHQVTVYTSNYATDSLTYPDLLTVKRLKPFFRFGNSPLLPGLLKIGDFDIIHLHHPFYFGSELTYLASKLRKFSYILSYHMDVPPERVHAEALQLAIKIHDRCVNTRMVSKAEKIIVTSLDYAKHSRMRDIFEKRGDDIVEIPNGVDLNSFHPKRNNVTIRKQYGIMENEKIVLFVGALDRPHFFKGLEYLLAAFSMINRNGERLLIVGEGDLKKHYARLATSLKIRDKVIFAGRAVSLPDYYAAADVLVLPSIDMSEAFGMVLVEAMASGIAVIASNLPGVRTVVDHEYNGLLATPKDARDLAVKLRYMLDNDEVRKLFGTRGRTKAEENYSWRKIALRLNETYLKTLEGR
jgi:glycosyltransferase involved in cell wall biosynthesis